MANRAFKRGVDSLVERLTYIQCRFSVGSTGAASSLQGSGVKSVTRSPYSSAVGLYTVDLEDSYNYLTNYMVNVDAPNSGSDVSDGSFHGGLAYTITTLGTQTGTLTITAPTSGHVYGMTVGGFTAKVVSQGSGAMDAAALAMLANGQYVTVVPAVAGVSNAQLVAVVPEVVLTAASVSGGPFTLDELVTGGTSGATGYITTAANASPITLVQVAPGPGGSGFVVGETATGGSSAASITVTGVSNTSVQVTVNTYPAENNLPVNAIAALVSAAPVGTACVLTYGANAAAPTAVPNPAITTVATNSAGSAAAFAQATMPATDWYALGVPAGVTPAVGVNFLVPGTSASQGGTGDGKAQVPATNLLEMTASVVQLANPSLQKGGQILVQFRRSDTGAVGEVPSGSIVRLGFLMRNSTIKGQGES